ncbi:MAG TPA: hypothetical protein VHS29_01470 [Candidatus Acidoferrales bacterium]|jgi:hypothetical protein|nr:hypothetical protein [Candidatus Acidoferrales bacterium]
MNRICSLITVVAVCFCVALAGCGGNNQFGSQPQNNGNSSVVLAMTDAPPSNASILSAKVTLTGATLSPGNVPLFSGSTTVELTRLQTDIAYITTATNIPAGNYTSVTLTFANPSLTIENDTGSTIGSCVNGTICTMAPTATFNLSTSVPLTNFTIAASSVTGLLIDENMETLLSSTLGADFSAGTSVTSFLPGSVAPPPVGAPPVGAEDVVGHVQNLNAANNTFTLTNALATYSLKVTSASTFFQFPSSATCLTPGFACLQNNQILSVDIGIQSDGTIYARNILFEDPDSSDVEVEGIVTSTNVALHQFNFVVNSTSASVTGITIGMLVTAQYFTSPQTPFDVDFVHADNLQITTSSLALVFTGPADLVPGQEISIRRNPSSGSTLLADRVRLRYSRVTATVQSVGLPNIFLTNLPSLFSGQVGVVVTQIIAQTSTIPPTIYYSISIPVNASTNIVNLLVSVRGPMFNTGGTNRTLIASKIVLQP